MRHSASARRSTPTLTLMPSYRWSCLACSTANAAASERCERCECPASPTYAQIRKAKETAGVVEPVDGPKLRELGQAFGSYLRGRPLDSPFISAFVFELLLWPIGVVVTLFVYAICKLLGMF
ncbi:MAG: hypothetical protein JWP41_4023 [Ramlibacter sp.]|nr:hypothetical protein [Ramlibacter sp.]